MRGNPLGLSAEKFGRFNPPLSMLWLFLFLALSSPGKKFRLDSKYSFMRESNLFFSIRK